LFCFFWLLVVVSPADFSLALLSIFHQPFLLPFRTDSSNNKIVNLVLKLANVVADEKPEKQNIINCSGPHAATAKRAALPGREMIATGG
jgi:hypothetical protein